MLNTSGILALTFCGLLLAAWGKSHVSAGSKQHVDFFWWDPLGLCWGRALR